MDSNKLVLLAGVLILLSAAGYLHTVSNETTDFELFSAWAIEHRKHYENSQETVHRFEVFKQTLKRISSHNSNMYTVKLNKFSDMTFEELSGIYLNPMPPHDVTETSTPLPMEQDVPEDLSWVAKGAVTGVKNQGKCGSCWSFSATGALEGLWFVKKGQLVSLSEQQLMDCSRKYGNKGCGGGWMDWAFDYVWDEPIMTEADYPYIGQDQSCGSDLKKGLFKVSGYTYVPHNREDQLKLAVAQQPVSVGLAVDGGLFDYHSGIYDGTCAKMVNHGVLAVGYGIDNGNKYWLVKNSWGADWGESGFVKLTREHGDLGGKCYIANQPVYPKL